MNFEKYIKEINEKITNFCKKYDLWELKNDLFTEAWFVFIKCEEKFKGDEKNFKKYFLKSLDNHLKNRVIREITMMTREIFFDDFENIEAEIKSEENLVNRLDVRDLSEEEIWFLNLLSQGFKLKEVAERLGISYERVKDIWGEIKAKLNPGKRSRKELRKIWRKRNKKKLIELSQKWKEENPLYFKEWREKNYDYLKNWKERNPDYMKNYLKLRRIIKDGVRFKNTIVKFFSFLCACSEVKLSDVEREKLCIKFFCNSLCECRVLLYDKFDKFINFDEFKKIVIFSNLNSLRNPENQLRCKRIFIYNGREFRIKKEMNLLPNFSNKKVLIITKSQKR